MPATPCDDNSFGFVYQRLMPTKNRDLNGSAPDGRWRITLPKPAERMKFQTWDQIERRIARGGLTEQEVSEQWRSLFLDEDQIAELLEHVKSVASFPSIYPTFVFAAYTGARRSELMNSLVEDFDFDAGQIMIRERKRRKDLSGNELLMGGCHQQTSGRRVAGRTAAHGIIEIGGALWLPDFHQSRTGAVSDGKGCH